MTQKDINSTRELFDRVMDEFIKELEESAKTPDGFTTVLLLTTVKTKVNAALDSLQGKVTELEKMLDSAVLEDPR